MVRNRSKQVWRAISDWKQFSAADFGSRVVDLGEVGKQHQEVEAEYDPVEVVETDASDKVGKIDFHRTLPSVVEEVILVVDLDLDLDGQKMIQDDDLMDYVRQRMMIEVGAEGKAMSALDILTVVRSSLSTRVRKMWGCDEERAMT
jgi:hypothetical protein